MVFCADIAALSKHCKEESASLILSRVLLPQTGQRIHSALLFISIRHLTDNTIKVNEIPVGIIPNSLKIRRVFNTVLRTLIVITNRRPRYIFYISVRSLGGSVICGKRNHFILFVKGKHSTRQKHIYTFHKG